MLHKALYVPGLAPESLAVTYLPAAEAEPVAPVVVLVAVVKSRQLLAGLLLLEPSVLLSPGDALRLFPFCCFVLLTAVPVPVLVHVLVLTPDVPEWSGLC